MYERHILGCQSEADGLPLRGIQACTHDQLCSIAPTATLTQHQRRKQA